MTEDWSAYFKALRDEKTSGDNLREKMQAQCHPLEVLIPGHEVSLEDVVRFSKNGKINQQSIMGKVVQLVLDSGGEVKAGHSRYFSGDEVKGHTESNDDSGKEVKMYRIHPGEEKDHYWVDCALNGERVTVTGSDIFFRSRMVKFDEFLKMLEEEK